MRAHCAHTLPARTARAHCALTLRARTARAKLLPKSWILLTKPLILLTKRSILPPKFANGQSVWCLLASVRCARAVSSACIRRRKYSLLDWIISNTIRHVALSLVNPSTLEVLGKPYYRKEMYGQHPHVAPEWILTGINWDRGIAPLQASRYFPIFARAAPRPTQCRKIKTPQVCKQSGTLSVRLPPHLSASFLSSWSSGGVQIVFGSFPLPLMHKLLPNLTQRRLQVLACIYCIKLVWEASSGIPTWCRKIFWSSCIVFLQLFRRTFSSLKALIMFHD